MELIGIRDRIDEFLNRNKRYLEYMESLFSIDDNRDRQEEFYKEGKLRVLCVYLTPASSRAVSNTHNALSSLSKKLDPDNIVVDSCYFPEDPNLEVFQNANIPYIFGSTCHEPIGFYDIVLMSNAVCPEVLNIPRFLSNSGIGLTIEQRDKQDIPLIFYGGAAANETSIVLGPIYRDGEYIGKSLIDIGTYGYGEKSLATLAKTMLDWKNQGLNLHDKPMIKEKLINEKVLSEYLFFSQYYEWVYDESDHFTIKEIKCLDERLPKQVKYARMRLGDDMGWTNKAFNLSGDNADSHDLMISSGCSGGSSNCSFAVSEGTRIPIEGLGLVKIEDMVGLKGWTSRFLKEDYPAELTDVVSVGKKKTYRVKLSSGLETVVSEKHLMQVIDFDRFDDNTRYVEEVKPGDYMLVQLGVEHFGDYKKVNGFKLDEELALLLGFIQGDGSVCPEKEGEKSKVCQLFIFTKGKETDIITSIANRIFGEVELKPHYTQKDGTVIYRWYKSGKDVEWLYYDLGISDGKRNRVPDVIFKSPKSVIQSYLRGLFQADGWTTNSQLNVERTVVGLTQVSYDFLQDVHRLLLMCGIYSHVSKREAIYRRDGSKRLPAHYIEMSNFWGNKFKREIGFIDKETQKYDYRAWRPIPVRNIRTLVKTQRDKIPTDKIRTVDDHLKAGVMSYEVLCSLVEYGLELPRIYRAIGEGRYYPVKVESIEQEGEVECYSTNVEPLHKMNYDLVYSHNCMEASVAGGYREKRLEDVEEEMKHTVRNCAPNTISWYCMSGDTKVLTDYGEKMLKDLDPTEDKVLTTKGYSKFDELVNTGVKKTIKVKLSSGREFEATPEHYFRVLSYEFDYDNYKPKVSDTKDCECLNYLAGKKLAEGFHLENKNGNEELRVLNKELLDKMEKESSYINKRAFIAGYVQNLGDMIKIKNLIDQVTEENEIPIVMNWSQLGTLEVGSIIAVWKKPGDSEFFKNVEDVEGLLEREVYESYNLGNLTMDTIVSMEESECETYDIIHTESADYIANGVVVGNSYNLNYYYRFMDLLATGAQYFSGVTLLNERLDVVANSPDQMKLAKKLGLKRFSGPVEGAGERIRDGFLNKNLDRKTLMKATHVISDLGLMHFKFGMILTGQETEDDMKEFLSEIDEMIKIRDEHGANHSYQINWCLTEEALSPIEGRGLVRQNDVYGRVASTQGNTEVSRNDSNGVRPILKMTLENGIVIRGTYEHPFVKAGMNAEDDQQFTYMKDLEPGDKIQVKLGTECFSSTNESVYGLKEYCTDLQWSGRKNEIENFILNKDTGFALGALVGDGNINSSDNRVEWCLAEGKDEKWGQYVKETMESLGYRTSEYVKAPKGQLQICGVDTYSSKSTTYLRVNSRQLKMFLLEQGFSQGAENKRVPTMILQSSKEVQCAFLKGLWSTDGSINSYRNPKTGWLNECIEFASKSEQLVRDVQIMLMNIGILSKVSQRKTGLWELLVYKHWYQKFMQDIGSFTTVKEPEERKLRPSKFINGDEVSLEVVSIEDDGEEETWAVKTESGRYITNGIISHNTPLVFYSQIALRWMPRITAENSYNNARTMSWFIEETRKRNIRCKFNGKGCGTWLEQMLLDFGPAGTDWMVGLVLDEGMGYIRFFGDKIKEASCRQLDKRGYIDHLFFTKQRPKDWIFPNDHILSIPVALQKMWWERTEAWFNGDPQAFHRKLCLRTPANLEGTKCYRCEMCETPEEIKFMVKRKLEDQHTYEEVAEMLSESREQKAVRVVVKQSPKWYFYNRTALAHYITSRFLQANDNIADQFFTVGKTTTTWLSNNGQKGWFGGTWCFDISLRDHVSINEFTSVIDQVNSKLESCQVIKVIDDTKTMKVKRETKISYIGQTTAWSLTQIKDKLSMFDWDIKIPVKSMGGQLDTEIRHMPELKDRVLFAQKGNGVIIGMDLPAFLSPYMVMTSILGKGYDKMLADFSFDIIDQVADTDMVDNKGQHIGYSYFKGEYNARASIETIRLYLYKLTH